MMDYFIPILAVLNTFVLGYLGYRTTRKKLTVDEKAAVTADKAQVAAERTAEIKLAVEGMADLVDNLRIQLDRERDDFHQRITQAEVDCKTRIDRVKNELQARMNVQAKRIRELEAQVGAT